MRVNVGDVILVDYYTFNGDKMRALFAVVYHEVNDNNTSNNFTAIKVSSEHYCYQIPLKIDYLKFLKHDSYLNCNQMFRFREQQVICIVGRLSPYYLNKMLQQTKQYFKRIEQGLISSIGEENLFKNLGGKLDENII